MAQPYFAYIVAGRALQTNFTQTGENEFVAEVAQAESINHLVVCLTGVQLFPEAYGGSVYIRLLGDGDATAWHYLGFIANAKPSAIFKIAQLAHHKSDEQSLFSGSAVDYAVGSVLIGLMIEPLSAIESKVAAESTAASTQSTMSQFVDTVTSNLINYLTSFVVSLPNPENPAQVADFIPAKAAQDWFANFRRRLQVNPNFWRYIQ